MNKKISLMDGTGGTWVQPDAAVDAWRFADAPIWSEVVGSLPRQEIEREWGVVAEVIEADSVPVAEEAA